MSVQRADGFPSGFRWGAATASYQIEGAASEDGRGPSIWDTFSHAPGNVRNGDTGDVACDHYHRYAEDIEIMRSLGLDSYRFSIAWPRIQPSGRGPANEAGLDFYDRLVDALLEAGLEPFATLYHWDLPQALEDAGGWPNRSTADAFGDYAHLVAERLGDRVRHWATLNEPRVSAEQGYMRGDHAPGRKNRADATATSHHLLLAHGLGMAAIRAAAPDVKGGIVLNFEPKHPATTHPLHLEAAGEAHALMNRWYLDPVMGRGYPQDGVRALEWDRAEVHDGDLETIAAPIDFLGVNYYSRHLITYPNNLLADADDEVPETAQRLTDMGWEVYPEGLAEILEWIGQEYDIAELYVTENGAAYPADPARPGHDPDRVSFLHDHLEAARRAIQRGVPLKGYFVWSLLDNFEWAYGYEKRFGIVHVDFDTQIRTVKDSGRYWAAVAATGEPDQSEFRPPGGW